MPDTFDPDHLRAELLPLSARQQPSEEMQAYQRFYGLNALGPGGSTTSRLGRFDVGGYEIAAQLWMPEQPVGTLVLIHGFYDHVGLYRHVVDWALGLGLAVIACDLPGHGLSSGARASITDFAEYQVVLDRLFVEAESLLLPKPWHLCGQSTGGAIVVDHLLHHGDGSPAQGQTILLAPLVRPRGWALSKLSYHLLRGFVTAINRRFSENSNAPTFLPFLLADPLQPRRLPTVWVGALAKWIERIERAPRSSLSPLIVQGESDMTVDWKHNLAVLRDKFDKPQIFMLHEARHHLANETPDLRAQFFEFLTKRMG
jgi:alpha-beta hydrolase superfamily lysophospholipase